MLDENSAQQLGRSLFAVLGSEFFSLSSSVKGTPSRQQNYSIAFNLRNIQELLRHKGIWRIVFASASKADDELCARLVDRFSFPFAEVIQSTIFDHEYDVALEYVRGVLQRTEMVFAPSFCQKHKLQPMMQPPSSDRIALSVVTYFTVMPNPFTQEEYKAALKIYDTSINFDPLAV